MFFQTVPDSLLWADRPIEINSQEIEIVDMIELQKQKKQKITRPKRVKKKPKQPISDDEICEFCKDDWRLCKCLADISFSVENQQEYEYN